MPFGKTGYSEKLKIFERSFLSNVYLLAIFLRVCGQHSGKGRGKNDTHSELQNFKVGAKSPVVTFARITEEPNWRLEAGGWDVSGQ